MNYRHGDIALIGGGQLPTSIQPSKTNILLQDGSGGNPHSFKGGRFYPDNKEMEGYTCLGFLAAKRTKLFHVEHSPNGGEIEDDTYEVRRQNEKTHDGMKVVID